jgi:hypothetical protein
VPAKGKFAPRLPARGEEEETEAQPPVQRKFAPRIPVREEEETEEAPAEERAPAPVQRKLAPRVPVRDEEETEEAPEEAPATAPRRLAPRTPVHEEDQTPVQRKFAPRIPVREEEAETEEAPAEERAPAPVQRKLSPRLPVREEEAESEEAPASAKLKPRFPVREEEAGGAAPEETETRAPASQLRRRVLPGMSRTAPSLQQTYVPPARERKQFPIPQQQGEPEEERQGEPVGEGAQGGEEAAPAEEGAEVSPRIAALRPRKLVSDEAPEAAGKTPEQLAQERKMAEMAKQLARLEAGREKEVAGTAEMPAEEEDMPPPPEPEAAPKPEEYEQAKESLRKTLEHDETARKVKQEDEALVEQYAKDHLVWLYEIYKMGGMGRADFLQKASEKYSEAQSGGSKPAAAEGASDAPPNPALANLSKVIEKKDKK